MRLGFIVGFLIGGGVASLMSRLKEREPARAASDELARARRAAGPVVERVKHQVEEAREAARQAQMEKEAEMRRMLDDMVHRKTPSGEADREA